MLRLLLEKHSEGAILARSKRIVADERRKAQSEDEEEAPPPKRRKVRADKGKTRESLRSSNWTEPEDDMLSTIHSLVTKDGAKWTKDNLEKFLKEPNIPWVDDLQKLQEGKIGKLSPMRNSGGMLSRWSKIKHKYEEINNNKDI